MFRGGAYIDPSQDAAAIPAGANISATLVSEKYQSIGASIPLTAYEGTSGASAKITSTSSALAFPLTSMVDNKSLKGKAWTFTFIPVAAVNSSM